MIKAEHNWLGKMVCDFYSNHKMKAIFRKINIRGDIFDNGLPVLLIANHFTRWDGFIQYRLNQSLYRRKFHVMMLEQQLLRYSILRKGGAFSVRKNSREILQSLGYCSELLNDNNNLVLLFPQGKIESLYTDHFRFENGLEYIISHADNQIQIIFIFNLIDYFSDYKPTLTIYLKRYEYEKYVNLHDMEHDFNCFYHECKKQQVEE